MAVQGTEGGAQYRAQLADIVRRARTLETRAREQHIRLASADPSYRHWISIERRYATVRGNAEHLLQVPRRRSPLLSRLMRRWKLR